MNDYYYVRELYIRFFDESRKTLPDFVCEVRNGQKPQWKDVADRFGIDLQSVFHLDMVYGIMSQEDVRRHFGGEDCEGSSVIDGDGGPQDCCLT